MSRHLIQDSGPIRWYIHDSLPWPVLPLDIALQHEYEGHFHWKQLLYPLSDEIPLPTYEWSLYWYIPPRVLVRTLCCSRSHIQLQLFGHWNPLVILHLPGICRHSPSTIHAPADWRSWDYHHALPRSFGNIQGALHSKLDLQILFRRLCWPYSDNRRNSSDWFIYRLFLCLFHQSTSRTEVRTSSMSLGSM